MNPLQKDNENKQELIYIPKQLRDISIEQIYQSLIKLNKKCFHYKQKKIIIKCQQYSTYLNQQKLKQCQDKFQYQSIWSIYLQSPNKNFMQKYIFIHPKMKFFVGNDVLQQIFKQDFVAEIIKKINQDTMVNLRRKLTKWVQKQGQKQKNPVSKLWWPKFQIEQQKQQLRILQTNKYNLYKIYEQDSLTIAELLLESKLQKIKLITTNQYLIKLQLVILFQLTKERIILSEKKIRYKQSNIMKLKNQYEQIKQKILDLPSYYPPIKRFLDQYIQGCKLFAQQNEQTINEIIRTQIKNNLPLQQKMQMKQIQNPQVKQILSQTESVFNEATSKGLLDINTSNRIKSQRLNTIINQHKINLQWNLNQSIIQRVIQQLFPSYSFDSKDYHSLVDNITKYCNTRSILSCKQDIEKFKNTFNKKYIQYLSKQGKGLPGGMNTATTKGLDFYRQIQRTFGPDAARKALDSICNIDSLSRLTEQQRNQFRQKAAKIGKQYKLNKSKQDAQQYIQNINQQRKNRQRITDVRNGASSSNKTLYNQTQKLIDTVKSDQIDHKRAFQNVLGFSNTNNDQNNLRGNTALNQNLKSKLPDQKLSNHNNNSNKSQIKNKQNIYPENIAKVINDVSQALTNLQQKLNSKSQDIDNLKKLDQNSPSYKINQNKIIDQTAKKVDEVKEKLNQANQQLSKEKQSNTQFYQNFKKKINNQRKAAQDELAQIKNNQDVIKQAKKDILDQNNKTLESVLSQTKRC